MTHSEDVLREEIMRALRGVMVPERNASVYDLKMVHDVQIEEDRVRLMFTPQSMLCSSVQVAFSIKNAVSSVVGFRRVELHVVDYETISLERNEE